MCISLCVCVCVCVLLHICVHVTTWAYGVNWSGVTLMADEVQARQSTPTCITHPVRHWSCHKRIDCTVLTEMTNVRVVCR